MLLIGGFAAGTHREKSKSDRNRCQGNLTARVTDEKAVSELFAVSSLEHFARTDKLLGEIPTQPNWFVRRDPHAAPTDIL